MFRDKASTIAGFALAAGAWYVIYRYALGSGIGYDALEYLVIGREVAAGASLYDFAPSKSPGIYLLVAALNVLGWQDFRGGVAALVASILIAMAALVFVALRRRAGDPLALAAAALTLLIGLAAELNFLEPTAFVFASGLGAWMALAGGRAARRELVAGLAVGLGILFKAVAAFYLVGIAAWLVVESGFTRATIASLVRIAAAAALPVLAAGACYFASGSLEQFAFWTFGFPLMHYPPDSQFLGKLAIKLGWTLAPVALIAALALTRRGRKALSESSALLACALGVCAGFALYKSQASHYAFPALAFVPVVLALMARSVPDALPGWLPPLAVCTGVVLLAGAIRERPDVLQRVFARPDQSWEQAVRARFSIDRSSGRALLALQGTSRTLWATGLRPLLPAVATDVQAAMMLRKSPGMLERLVESNPSAYVELDPDELRTDAPAAIDDPRVRAQFVALVAKLRREYERVPDAPAGLVLWRRRSP